jgi:AcrR family transcriptional regulator
MSTDHDASRTARASARRLTTRSDETQPRRSPRERLLDATAELVGRDTYATTTVAQIASRAEVSSATFYTLFEDKEDCFLAAYTRIERELLSELERLADTTDPSQLWHATLDAIFEFAARKPQTIRLLADEATLSKRRALQAREELVTHIEAAIEGHARDESGLPDVPAKVLVGATLRLLVIRLRKEDSALEDLRTGLVGWIESYRGSGVPRWQLLAPIEGLRAGPANYSAGLSPPQRPPRGRSRLSAEQVAQNQRERILHATAEVTASKGYAETTVADVVASAGLAREVFYRHFRDKQDAFMTSYETGFQALMALSVGSFFSSLDWPERIWAALVTYADFMVNFPTFAHLGMVESHTIGVELVDERVMAFTVFLQASYREQPHEIENAAVISEAIAMSIYEVTSHLIRHGRNSELPGLVPLMTYIVLAPFLGADVADAFVERKVADALASRH